MSKLEKITNQNPKEAMSDALKKYLKDKSSAKSFSLCMKETTQWLKEKEK